MKQLFSDIKAEFEKYRNGEDPLVVKYSEIILSIDTYLSESEELDAEVLISLLSEIDLDLLKQKKHV